MSYDAASEVNFGVSLTLYYTVTFEKFSDESIQHRTNFPINPTNVVIIVDVRVRFRYEFRMSHIKEKTQDDSRAFCERRKVYYRAPIMYCLCNSSAQACNEL